MDVEYDWEDDELTHKDPIVLDIATPEVFEPLLQPKRYKGAKGGRGSGKSHFFGELLVEECISQHTRAACVREVQKSLDDSVKRLIEDKIYKLGVESLFRITKTEIICPRTESLIIFRGMQNHTASSIKSLEGFNRAFIEEAQTITQRSLEILTPTFRNNAELWFAWNPESENDPVDKLFLENLDDLDFVLVEANYNHNPFFPEELRRDMERDRQRDIDKYNHVWGGQYRKNSEARVFKNYTVRNFITPKDAMFLHGADWGYSVDPTTLVRCFTGGWGDDGEPVYDPNGTTLFIDAEAYMVGCEINNTPRLFDQLLTTDPDHEDYGCARKYQIRADSARPETIGYMRKHGYPLMVSATKGPKSVVEGIEFIKNYDVVIHTRCKHTKSEFDYYKYKIDKLTNAVTSELEDKKNHVIDAVRYAVELVRKNKKMQRFAASQVIGGGNSGSSSHHLGGSLLG